MQKRQQDLWPGGAWSIPARNYFCALMNICGKPTLAFQLMEELELWLDHRRPYKKIKDEWAHGWRDTTFSSPEKVQRRIEAAYKGYRRGDMEETIRLANEAYRTIATSVIKGKFDKDYSGALQHLGQFSAIATEKMTQAYNPKAEAIPVTNNNFIFAEPPRPLAVSRPQKKLAPAVPVSVEADYTIIDDVLVSE